jgi:DNA helicase-4
MDMILNREISLPNIEFQRLEGILTDIEKQRSFQILGYILMPIIIGFFILKIINDKILILTKNKDELTNGVIKELETSNNQIKNILKYIKCADAYLVYSDRIDILNKLEEYKIILFNLRQKKEIFEKYFNNVVEISINEVIESQITIENFNKNLIESRKKEYGSLFQNSTNSLNDEQKNAIITDDKHNLVVAGAGSGKTEILITRIAYLVLRKQEKIAPDRILALAFQDKARKEIEDRLIKKFGIKVKIKTFHSFGNEVLSKPKLKFNTDTDYNEFIAELYKKAEKYPEFQNKLLNYILHFGDEEIIKQESDFKTKNEWYQYIRNIAYTTLDGKKVKSEGERKIFNFLFTHKINQKSIKFYYECPAKWMNYKNEKGEINTPKPDFFLPEYKIYIEHWAIDEIGNVPEWFDQDYRKGMKAKIEGFRQQKKYSLVETTYGELKNNNFIERFENKLIKEIRRKYPDQDFVFTEMSYSEIVERVWEKCKNSMKQNAKNIANFIKTAKTNDLKPEKILERLEKEKWSPKQKAFAELALVIYRVYEKELRLTLVSTDLLGGNILISED